MFQIEYKSKNGSFIMGGGAHSVANVTALSGFDFPTKNFTTVEYAGENGDTVTGKKDMARTLTISGVLTADQSELARVCRILYEDGELHCIFNDVRRKIECRCTTLSDFERMGHSGKSKFAIQFIADYPYFTDIYQHTIPIFQQKNLVTTTFTLPCIFTQRISAADIFNSGDKLVYPVLYIKTVGAASGSSGSITITNSATGAIIKIENYLTADDETITVNLATRRIISNVNGNITNYISDDTDLSKFYFDVGKNHIAFVNASGQHINATAVYSPEYIGAVR